MGELVELEIPARTEYISLARLVVTVAAEIEPTFSHERIEDLRVAVSEACTNAIEAHVSTGQDDRIVIRCDLAEDRIEVEVSDSGGGFDLGEVSGPPDPEHPDRLDFEGGLGIPLMKVLTDETEFRVSEGGTVVKLVVRHRARPGPPPDPGRQTGDG